jgi:hypothetical protein
MGVEVSRKLMLGIVLLLVLLLVLLSCHASNLGGQDSWKIYHNGRYGFEFPYLINWEQIPIPDNRDGRAFCDPQNPSVKIRGWAINQLSKTQKSSTKKSAKFQQENFTTEQKLTGNLQVEMGADISSMNLTLSQNKI